MDDERVRNHRDKRGRHRGWKFILALAIIIFLAVSARDNQFLSALISHRNSVSVEILQEKLQDIAEMNTYSYLCTDVVQYSDSKEIGGVTLPLTEKNIILKYSGVVKTGIRDLAAAKISVDGDDITIALPEVEITGVELDNRSFELLDESDNVFNPVTSEDINTAQLNLKDSMISRAEEMGIMEMARQNAETILKSILQEAYPSANIQVIWETEEPASEAEEETAA